MTEADITTGALFAALKKLGRSNHADHAILREVLDLFEQNIRVDVQNVHASTDRVFDQLCAYVERDRWAVKWAGVIEAGVLSVALGIVGFSGYQAWTAKNELRATSSELTRLRAEMVDGTLPDLLGMNGLPARIECVQTSDGRAGIDVHFSASRSPVPGSNNGSFTTSKGTLRSDGATEGKTETNDGTELSASALRPMAELCRRSLTLVPGTAG
jgi:hypothetical protein